MRKSPAALESVAAATMRNFKAAATSGSDVNTHPTPRTVSRSLRCGDARLGAGVTP